MDTRTAVHIDGFSVGSRDRKHLFKLRNMKSGKILKSVILCDYHHGLYYLPANIRFMPVVLHSDGLCSECAKGRMYGD
jgi:hypothetical protein